MTIVKSTPQFGESYRIGDIGFTRTFDLIGDAIAYGEHWEQSGELPSVNHVFVVAGNDYCIQAHISDGVQTGGISAYLDDPKSRVYFRRPLLWTRELGVRIASSAASKIGCKYAKDLIIETALADTELGHEINVLFDNWPHHELAKLLTNPLEFMCSMLGAASLFAQPEYKKCPLFANPLGAISPQALLENGPFEPTLTDVNV